MTKRAIAWISTILIGCLAAIAMLASLFGATTVSFSENEIQSRLNAQLPRTVKDVTVESVTARLSAGRIALRTSVSGTTLRQPFSAVVTSRGAPRYDPKQGAVYFDADDVGVEQLIVRGRALAGEDETASRGRMAEAANSAVRRIAESAIKTYLAARPVYRFKDDFKGTVLKATITGVEINGSSLAISVSLWQFSAYAIGAAIVLLLAIAFVGFLLRNPLWGLAAVSEIATG